MKLGMFPRAPIVVAAALLSPERQGVNIDDYPSLKKWRDQIAGRPAVKMSRTVAVLKLACRSMIRWRWMQAIIGKLASCRAIS